MRSGNGLLWWRVSLALAIVRLGVRIAPAKNLSAEGQTERIGHVEHSGTFVQCIVAKSNNACGTSCARRFPAISLTITFLSAPSPFGVAWATPRHSRLPTRRTLVSTGTVACLYANAMIAAAV